MSSSPLCGADQVRHSRPFELEVGPLCYFESFASFHHESFSVGSSVAIPTKGELLAQLETLSRKPRSVKRKTLDSVEKGQSAMVKVPKLGASSSSPSTHVRKPERTLSPSVEAPAVLSSQPRSGSAAKVKGPLG